MNRCKTLLLALVASAGLAFATGCDQNTQDDSNEEQASAEAAEEEKEKEKSAEKPEKADGELPLEATGPVAVVDGTEITADRFNDAISKQAGAMGGQMPPRVAEMMKTRTVDRLIDEHLIDQQLAETDVKISDEEVDKEFAKFKERFPNEEAFSTFLTRNGVDEAEMKENLQKDLQLRSLLEDKYGIEVTEADAKKHYEENPERFEQEEQVSARHVLIKTEKGADEAAVADAKKRAEEIAKEAKKPDTDFAALAKEKSEGPTADRGGDLGFFTKKRMVPEFADVAFEMEPGDISDPVKSQFGFHVIKVEDRKEAGKADFEEAKEDILTQLQRTQFRDAMQKYLEEIKSDIEITRNEDNIKVNVEAPKQGAGAPGAAGPHGAGGGGMQGNPQLQKQLQQQLQKRAAEQKKQQQKGGSDSKDPTEAQLPEPKLGK